jgi:Outer membrane protein beta-barrel domain
MRKFIMAAVCSAVAYLPLQAQSVKYGLKVGISTTDVAPSDLTIRNSATDSFRLKLDNAGYGYQFGAFTRFKLLGLFVQPELLFNSNKATYKLQNLARPSVDSIRTETYSRLDIPILIGYRFGGMLRLNAGPIAHINISSSSDLTNTHGYEQKFASATWGYQAGVGLDFGKLGIDLRYEGNFTNYGDHLTFGGKEYTFDKKPSRLVASLAYSF